MFLTISVGIASLFSLFQWLSATLFTMFPKKPRKTCNRLPPRCQHSVFLQGVCLHDSFTTGAVTGKCSAKSTKWYSFRPNRRMEEHVDNSSIFGQETNCWIAIVDHHFGFIKSLRYNKLGRVVGSFASTKKNKSIHLESAMQCPIKREEKIRHGTRLPGSGQGFPEQPWILQCTDGSIKHRLRYFAALVSSTVCFAARH